MKIAVLQFSPILGTVHENIAKADALLKEARAEGRLDGVQLLIGPEMAFTGRLCHDLFSTWACVHRPILPRDVSRTFPWRNDTDLSTACA